MTRKRPPKPERREPSDRERADIAAARLRTGAKPWRPYLVGDKEDKTQVGPPHNDIEGWTAQISDIFGTSSGPFAAHCFALVAAVADASKSGIDRASKASAALAAVAGLEPRNEGEGLLAALFVSNSLLGLDSLARAATADTLELRDAFSSHAAKATKSAVLLADQLAKAKGGSQQKVTVIHEHRTYVAPGAQAVVGEVHMQPPGTGGADENGPQPHRPPVASIAFAPGAPVWGEDTSWDHVPVAGGERTEALQAARLREGRGRTAGLGEWPLSDGPADEGDARPAGDDQGARCGKSNGEAAR